MLTLDVFDVQERLEEILDLMESGTESEIVLTRDGKPVALLQHMADADNPST